MIQLEDLVATYPLPETPGIQTLISSKREFIEVGALSNEPPPKPGKTFYNNQKFLLRYMIPNDRLLVKWETGTGKTCGFVLLAEHYHKLYLNDPENAPIKRVIILTPPSLVDEIKNQIACRCTDGQYLTSIVTQATKDKVRRGNLTRELNKWYRIETYGQFVNGVSGKNSLASFADEELKRRFSRTIIIVDEAHGINFADESNKETGKKIIYDQLWRLFHIIEGSKVVLATATPMINESLEIAPLINLLLPGGPNPKMPFGTNQLPLDIDYNKITLEQIEPYFRGKVSYVRSLDTGINIEYKGEDFIINVGEPEEPIDTIMTVDTSVMNDIQREAYTRAYEQGGGVYDKARQSANFVFPDGTWAGRFPRDAKGPEDERRVVNEGLGKYVTSPVPDTYYVNDELKDWLRVPKDASKMKSSEKYLDQLSSKYASQVRNVMNKKTPGTVFVFNDFVFGSGVILQGLCYEVNGWERYRGDRSGFQDLGGASLPSLCSSSGNPRKIIIDKKKRYAMITNETPAANLARILDLFSSPENVHGEYLEVLIGSPVTREGLNLSHVTKVFLTTTWWNRSANYQAISRAIRATSHVQIIEAERKRLQDEKEALIKAGRKKEADDIDLNDVRVNVEIYQQVALPYQDSDAEESIDLYMYQIIEGKDYSIRRIERFIKQTSVDCWAHQERNIRICDKHKSGCDCWKEGDKTVCADYTSQCDYAPCQYECFDPFPEVLDLETYDVYYADETVAKVAESIVILFHEYSSLTHKEIINFLNTEEEEVRDSIVDRALTHIIVNKKPILDRNGFVSYLYEDNARFFLQYDYPINPGARSSSALDDYNTNLIATREISLPLYLSSLDIVSQEGTIEAIINMEEDDSRFEELFESLNQEGRIRLFEEAMIAFLSDPTNVFLRSVLEPFANYFYIVKEPADDLKDLSEKIKNQNKQGKRGRPRKEGTEPKAIKMNSKDLKSNIEYLTLDDALNTLDTDVVIIHTLYSNIFDRVSYNVSTKFKKGDGRLRLYKMDETGNWRDANIDESPVYSAIIERNKNEYLSNFSKSSIYGTILKDKKFRIIDQTTEKSRKKSTGDDDDRFKKKGLVCATADVIDLVTIMWKLEIGLPPGKREIREDREAIVNIIKDKLTVNSDLNVEDFEDDRLDFYYLWFNYGTKDRICQYIRQWMDKKKLIAIPSDTTQGIKIPSVKG